ncbi:MAG: F0F1 ATP synthase subunit B [Bacilli bacterium]
MVTLLDVSFIEDLYSKLIPNLPSFLVQLLALIVLIVLAIVLAYKPLKKMLKTRQDYIEENILESEKAKAQSIENLRKTELALQDVKKEASQIITDAKTQAIKESEKIKERSAEELDKMKADAEKEIAQKQLEAQENVRKEIIDVALLASSELLSRNISSSDNKKIVEDFIEEING